MHFRIGFVTNLILCFFFSIFSGRSSYISPATSPSVIYVNRRTSVVTVIRKISFDGVSLDPDGDEAKKKKVSSCLLGIERKRGGGFSKCIVYMRCVMCLITSMERERK